MIVGLLSIMLPVFGCILIGYVLTRKGIIETKGADALNKFVYFAAFPALLFTFVARTPINKVYNQEFLLSWLLSLGITYLATLTISKFVLRDEVAEMAVRAMNCTCSNTAFMGIPLLILTLGKEAALAGILATMVIVTVFFNVTLAMIEIGRCKGALSIGQTSYGVVVSLAKNPLMLAVFAGALSSAMLPMPKAVTTFGELLGNAAVPCSLVVLGAFIASQSVSETVSKAIVPTTIKLLLHPIITWIVVTWVVKMDTTWCAIAILLSALPTATSCFVIAKQHNILVAESSGTIWMSTILSAGTILIVLSLLHLV